MTVKGRQELARLCYAKLYEFELMAYAEERLRSESEKMAEILDRCSVKALGDYRALLRTVRRQPRVSAVRPHSERMGDIIAEIIDTKEKWISMAQACAIELTGSEKAMLHRICENEIEEIYKLRRCLS